MTIIILASCFLLNLEPPSILPVTFDEDQARTKLMDYYYNKHRPPGEPLFIPELHHSNAITQHCPAVDQLRRDDVSRTRLHVKFFFNDQQVSQTKDWYAANCTNSLYSSYSVCTYVRTVDKECQMKMAIIVVSMYMYMYVCLNKLLLLFLKLH